MPVRGKISFQSPERLLSVLSGHWRYAHIKAMRGDGVNLGLLAIDGTVSEDVVRQAMMRINQTQGLEWLNQQVVSDGEA